MQCEPTVFVVDDDEDLRRSLIRLLEEVDLAVADYASASDFLEAYEPATPGCLLLDIRMPGMSGIQLQRHMLDSQIFLPIIFITGHGDISMAVESMKHGAFDFIEKPFRAPQLLETIQRALERDREQRDERAMVENAKWRWAHLTTREREVAELALSGLSNAEIASELGTRTETVTVDRSKGMWKLRARNMADLFRLREIAQRP
jgi:FixJ family two-component response regulator